jgi:glycosyltransferase involved in cell wall biosynthesis
MREADGFVVLTEKARALLFTNESRPVEVIPCCVDFDKRFSSEDGSKNDIAEKLGARDRFVAAHVGALGGLYLTEEIVDFLDAVRQVEPSTFALFVTQSDPAPVTRLLRERGFNEKDYFVGRLDPTDVPRYLSIANVGLSFVKATHATQSRSPTKIPEYLAAGLPIIANSGVGDVDDLINSEGVGVAIENFDREAYLDAFRRFKALGDISERCREVAKRRFDLESVGGVRYRRLYKKILCKDAD